MSPTGMSIMCCPLEIIYFKKSYIIYLEKEGRECEEGEKEVTLVLALILSSVARSGLRHSHHIAKQKCTAD